MTLHFLNDVANDTKIENYVIVASLESETMGKLITNFPCIWGNMSRSGNSGK